MDSMLLLLIGLILSAAVAFIAYQRNSLTRSGMMVATFNGALLFWWGGWLVWVCLILFFISSSILSKIKHRAKQSLEDVQVRGGRRDHVQVMANSLVPLIFSFIYFYFVANPFLLVASVTAIASSNSDTWASELGVLSKGKTISILSFKVIDKGLSGGISLFGTFIAFLGALFIGLSYGSLVYLIQQQTLTFALSSMAIIVLGGFAGCFVDSYLGAALQAKYKVMSTGKMTEKRIFNNEATVLIAGIRWITNDVVNFSSSLTAALLAFFLQLR